MFRDRSWRRPAFLVLTAVAVFGCGASTGASPSPSVAPAVTVTARPTATESPSSPPESAAPIASNPTTPEPPMPEPPPASLQVEGGDPVVGELGGFTWKNGGSAAPWLRGTPIHVGAGERLTLTLAEPVGIANWTANYVSADELDSVAPTGLGEKDGEPVSFDAPPPGRWSVHVGVWFADGQGDAAYFWLVEVD